MTDENPMARRNFLVRAWQAGIAMMAIPAAWTTWDLLRPLPTTGFGGTVKAVKADVVPEDNVLKVPAARSFLTRVNGEVVALSEKCTHLGCGVPFCESSGRFECPCHGSVFNRAGDYVAGPAPRGMDMYPVETGEDGFVYINTGERVTGNPPGDTQIDSAAKGPSCAAEGTHG